MTDRRRLIVMRHAKAEPFASSDHARRLSLRGRASARDAGAHLQAHDVAPEYVVLSSADRTRETWDAVAERLDVSTCEVRFDDELFTGSVDVAVEALRAAPADAGTVMFLGHNPTAANLCHLLDDGGGDPAAVSGLLQGFPPGAMTILEVGVPWAELGAETGQVIGYYVGQG